MADQKQMENPVFLEVTKIIRFHTNKSKKTGQWYTSALVQAKNKDKTDAVTKTLWVFVSQIKTEAAERFCLQIEKSALEASIRRQREYQDNKQMSLIG